MPNPTTTADVEARWRPLTSEQTLVATTLLDDAWNLLRFRVLSLEARLAAVPPTLDVGLVKAVMAAMVIRVLRNPDGYRQQSIEDYSHTRDEASSTGLLTVTDDELGLLGPSTGSDGGAYTVIPYTYPPPLVDTL